ncbi:hypothetical protein PJP12_29660, partial [Mycobacterium kansasii]
SIIALQGTSIIALQGTKGSQAKPKSQKSKNPEEAKILKRVNPEKSQIKILTKDQALKGSNSKRTKL